MNGTRSDRYLRRLRLCGVFALAAGALASNAGATSYPLPFNAAAGTWGWLASGGGSQVIPGGGAAAASTASRAMALNAAAAANAVEVGKNAILIGRNGVPIIEATVPLATSLVRGGAVALEVASAVNLPLLAGLVTIWALAQPSIPGSLSNLVAEMGYTGATKNADGSISLMKSQQFELGCDFNFDAYYFPYSSDPSVTKTNACIINPDGNTYTAGFSYSSAAHNWPAASWPCGNSSCLDNSTYFYSLTANAPKKKGSNTQILPFTDLTDRLANQTNFPPSSAIPNVIKDIATSGQDIPVDVPFIDVPAVDPTGITTTSTTTNPDGTTQTSTTTTTPHVVINPSDTATITSSSKTQNPDGSQTTSTSDKPQTETDLCKLHPDIIACQKEWPDYCKKNPDILACKKLDIPTGQDIPKDTKNVSFGLDRISWGAGASCPPPWSFTAPVINTQYAVSYEPFCDVATRIRPFIMAGAAFVAMMIVAAGIKA